MIGDGQGQEIEDDQDREKGVDHIRAVVGLAHVTGRDLAHVTGEDHVRVIGEGLTRMIGGDQDRATDDDRDQVIGDLDHVIEERDLDRMTDVAAHEAFHQDDDPREIALVNLNVIDQKVVLMNRWKEK